MINYREALRDRLLSSGVYSYTKDELDNILELIPISAIQDMLYHFNEIVEESKDVASGRWLPESPSFFDAAYNLDCISKMSLHKIMNGGIK